MCVYFTKSSKSWSPAGSYSKSWDDLQRSGNDFQDLLHSYICLFCKGSGYVMLVESFYFGSLICVPWQIPVRNMKEHTGCLKKNWVLPNWAFADPVSNWGEILNDFCGKSSCIMLWVGNFNAFIGRFVDTALGAYRVWKGALKNKRLHKNKWFLKIIQTGINPTTPDLTGSTGFVTKNHKYFSPITSRICKCFIWQNSVFLDTLYNK